MVEGGVLTGNNIPGCYVKTGIYEMERHQMISEETFAPILHFKNIRTQMRPFKFKIMSLKAYLLQS